MNGGKEQGHGEDLLKDPYKTCLYGKQGEDEEEEKERNRRR